MSLLGSIFYLLLQKQKLNYFVIKKLKIDPRNLKNRPKEIIKFICTCFFYAKLVALILGFCVFRLGTRSFCVF
jgi:hypothetical protein